MQKYNRVLPGGAGVGNSGGSMDPAHRARADSRQPSVQRDRARAAGHFSLAACIASAGPGSRGRHRAPARCAAECDGVSPLRRRHENSSRWSRPSARGVCAGRSANRRPEELDAGLLVWKIHQRIDRERLPERRTVVEFDFTGPRGRRVWLVLEPREVSVCVTPPRFDADLVVRADLAFFYRVWLGHVDYDAATRCGAVVVDGPPALARQLPRWFMWSPMARFVRERQQRAS